MRKLKPSRFRKLAFIALFGAMSLVALRLASKPSTNLLQNHETVAQDALEVPLAGSIRHVGSVGQVGQGGQI